MERFLVTGGTGFIYVSDCVQAVVDDLVKSQNSMAK